jgi:hypothetical protein
MMGAVACGQLVENENIDCANNMQIAGFLRETILTPV